MLRRFFFKQVSLLLFGSWSINTIAIVFQVNTGVSYFLDYVEDIYDDGGPLCPVQPKPYVFTTCYPIRLQYTLYLIPYSLTSCCHKSNTYCEIIQVLTEYIYGTVKSP